MKKNPLEAPEKIEAPKTPSQKDYLEIKIPRLTFRDTHINAYLVTALVIFAFLLGMLTNKVLFLENALKTQNTNPAAKAAADNNPPPQAPTPPSKVDVAIGHLPSLGGENAKVVVVEFSDFQCPYCKQFIDNTYPELFNTYIKTNKIKFVYRHYPLTTIHPSAQKAAEASECANEQGKFWEYHDLLFKNQQTWSPESATDVANTFIDYATQLGINTAQFQSCLETNKYQELVADDSSDGNKAFVDGTPTFFINGWRLVGAQPFAALQQRIEEELKK